LIVQITSRFNLPSTLSRFISNATPFASLTAVLD